MCCLREHIQGPLMEHASNQRLNSIIIDRKFHLNNMSLILPEEVVTKIHSTYVKQVPPMNDTYNWSSRNHNNFSTKAAELVSKQNEYEGPNYDLI